MNETVDQLPYKKKAALLDFQRAKRRGVAYQQSAGEGMKMTTNNIHAYSENCLQKYRVYTCVTALLGLLCSVLVTMPAYADVTFVHTDHLGSPAVYTNGNGEVIGREFNTPYGESLNPPTTNDTVSFTGHIRDGDTDLVYMQARYYDPNIGRFLSVDSVTFSSDKLDHFNRYWYASGNPYMYIDPNGEDTLTFYTSASLQAFGYGAELSLELGVSFGDDPFDIGAAGTFSTPAEIEYMPDQVGIDTGVNAGLAHYDAGLEELDAIPTESIEIDIGSVSADAVINTETGQQYGTRLTLGSPQLSAGVEDEATGAVSVRGAVEDVARYVDAVK